MRVYCWFSVGNPLPVNVNSTVMTTADGDVASAITAVVATVVPAVVAPVVGPAMARACNHVRPGVPVVTGTPAGRVQVATPTVMTAVVTAVMSGAV